MTGKHSRARRRLTVAAIVVAAMLALAGGTFAWATVYFNPDYSWYTNNPDATTYTVSTAGQLQALSDLVDGTAYYDDAVQPAVNFEGKTVKLGGDIALLGNLNGTEFYPIGTEAHPFAGTFDGQGKTIAGLKITEATAADLATPYHDIGLFGYCSAASTIRNVTLEDSCRVQVACALTGTTVSHVGALVGYTAGSVSGCTSRARVSATWDDGSAGDARALKDTVVLSGISGLAGVCEGDLTNDSFTGSLTVSTTADAYYDKAEGTSTAIIAQYIGGVAGRSGGDAEDASSGDHTRVGDISGCTNAADITVTTSGAGGKDRFGETVDSKSQYVGGIAGYAIGNVTDCTNTGDILGTSYVPGTSTNDDTGYLRANGGAESCGGIVGSLRGERTRYVYYTVGSDAGLDGGGKDPLTVSGCTNMGAVTALVNVGGICGQTGTYTTVQHCANGEASKVRADETVAEVICTRWNKPCAGGIVGTSYGEVSYCRNHGGVRNTKAGYYVGGIVGNMYYYTDDAGQKTQPNPEIFACYNTGQVYCSTSFRRGAIVGGNGGYTHDCLFLYGTANLSEDEEVSAIGENSGTYARLQVAYASDAEAAKYSGISLKSAAAVTFLNNLAPLDGWSCYYIKNAASNNGYPILNDEGISDGSVDLASLEPQINLARNASYTSAYNPTPDLTVTVTVNGQSVTLTQGADYIVEGDPDALGSDGLCKGTTAVGETPYKATVKGIGSYTGTLSGCCAYGIDKGSFAECTLLVTPTTYTGEAQNNPTVEVTDASGATVSASDYTCTVNNGADCIEPSNSCNIYYVGATATASSNYYGAVQGIYTIEMIDLAKDCDVIGLTYGNRVWYYNEDNAKLYEVIPVLDANGNLTYDSDGFVVVEGAATYDDDGVIRSKATPRYTDDSGATVYGMSLDYTGGAIDPTVIGVTWKGKKLDGSLWQYVYGGGTGGASASGSNHQVVSEDGFENIEASSTGAVTVAHNAAGYTKNYVVMNFDIVPIRAQTSDFTIKYNWNFYAYNDGKQPTVPLKSSAASVNPVNLIYNGFVVAASNYQLVPDYSVDNKTGDKHKGAEITYNAGDTIWYDIKFVDDSSIVCSTLKDAVALTIVSNQTELDNDSFDLKLDNSGCVYSTSGLPEPVITLTEKSSGKQLTKNKDYYVTYWQNTGSYTDKVITYSANIYGIGNYAGVIQADFTMQPGLLTSSMFDSSSSNYDANIKLVNLAGAAGALSQSGLMFAYRVNGYTVEDIEEQIGARWKLNGYVLGTYYDNAIMCFSYGHVITDTGIHNTYVPLCKVSRILDSSGNQVDTVKAVGTYTVTLVHNSDANCKYFDTPDDFQMNVTISVNRASLDDNDLYVDSATGISYIYAQKSAYRLLSTRYSYTGHPITPNYMICDAFDLWLSGPYATTDEEMRAHAFPSDQYEVYIAGYDTEGPTEVNDSVDNPYIIQKVSATPNSTMLCGTHMIMSLLLPADRYQFSIVPADISDSSIVSTTVDSAYYNGSALTPAVHFSIGGTECNYVEGEDYSLTYANNVLGADATSANPPTVTINILNHTHLVAHDADGNEVDSITVPFTIGYTPVALANATWSVGSQVSLDASSTVGALGEPDLSATYVSTDAAQTVRTVPADAYTVETGTWDGSTFTVKTNGWKAGDQVWYRVSANGKNLAFTGQTVVGPSTVVAAATANSFTDLGKSGNSMVATFSQTAYTYTGAQIEPNLAIVDGAKIKTLTRGIDYTLSYGANLNAGTGAGTVTVKGKGAYTGTCTLGFDIAPASLSDCTTTVADQVYTGAQLKPAADKVTVSLGGAALQAADWALDASGYGSNTVAGDAGGSLTITAGTSGNLTGSLNVTFPIERRALSASDFAATQSAAKTYTGLPITLSAGDLQVTDTVNARTLAYGTDYVVNYAGDHTSAGKATIWISGQGNYASSMSATFTIGAVDLATAMVLPDPASYTYTGAAVKAAAAVKLGGQTLTERYTAVTGEVCGDYGLNYTNNVNAGDASSSNPPTVTAAGRGNYTGTSSAAFAIVPATMSVGNTTVTLAESSFVYTGAEIKPVPIVKMGDVTLPATDYDVSYTANVAVGTATVTVTGKAPNFDAKASTPVSTTFQITRASLADCTVAAVPDQYYAFGSAVAPSLDIKNAAGTALVEGTDYKVTITNNTSVGTASVAITGIGAYEGSTASTTFKIVKVPISTDDVSASPTTFAYDGNAHAPAVTVTVEGHTLAEGTDYQLNYLGDRTSVGTQVIEIQALAPYLTSSATVSYSIVKSSWSRLYGQTALDTMRSIVGKGWPTSSSGSTCPTVVIATMGGYWDALTASALAGLNDCPVLLTNGSSLSDQTRAEIKRLGATKVYIAGGTAAVSQKVQDQLTSELGVKVTRLAGDNASGTALKIYEQGKGSWSKTAVIATAATFQDALSVSPYAYAKASPVFLANVGTSNGSMKLADDVVSALKQGGFTNAIITGGTAAISSSVEQQLTSAGIGTGHVTRLWGNTAYETSSAIASYCVDNGMSADYLGVATGEDYYDALSGAALCGRNNAALVLVSDHNTSAIDSFIRGNRASITAGYVFGGSAAVSDAVYAKCVAATG